MRTYLSCAMALLFLPLFTEPVAAQSSDSSQLRCDSTVIYNVNDIIVGKIINVYDQRGNILSETTYSGDNITKRVEYTYSGQGYKTTTYKRRKGELTRTEESEYNNLGQVVVKIEYPEFIYSEDGGGEILPAKKTEFTYHANGIKSSETLYEWNTFDTEDGTVEFWAPTEYSEYDNYGGISLNYYGAPDGYDIIDYYPDFDKANYYAYHTEYKLEGNVSITLDYCHLCGIVDHVDEMTYDSYGRTTSYLTSHGAGDWGGIAIDQIILVL